MTDETFDIDQAQDKLDELGADIEATKRKVESDLARPASEGPRWVDSGSESTGDDADDQTIAP